MELRHFDATQHSAAMLCDLQCPSNVCASLPLSPQSILQTWWWTQLTIYLMHMSIMTIYKSLLVTLWTLSPARMTRLLTTIPLPTSSTSTRRQRQQSTFPLHSLLTTHLNWSTLAQLLLATGQHQLGSSAQALTPGHRGAVAELTIAPLISRVSRRVTDDKGHDKDGDPQLGTRDDRRGDLGRQGSDLG